MSEWPETIIAREDYDGTYDGQWISLSESREGIVPPGSYYTYTRADRLAALQAENERLIRERDEAVRVANLLANCHDAGTRAKIAEELGINRAALAKEDKV